MNLKKYLVKTKPEPLEKAPVADLPLNKAGNRRGMHNAKVVPIQGERRFWNKHMPRLACDNCAFVAQCPQYRAGHECSFLPFLHGHSITNERDLIEYAKQLAAENMRRVHQGMMMETMTGAAPSSEMSEQLSMAINDLMKLHQRITDTKVQGSLTVSKGGGVVAQLFGSMDDLMEHVDTARNTINGTPLAQAQELQDESALEAALSGKDFVEIGLPDNTELKLARTDRQPQTLDVMTVSAPRRKAPVNA